MFVWRQTLCSAGRSFLLNEMMGIDELEDPQLRSQAYRAAVLSNRHYVRREKANGRQARMTSLFDVRCAARLRNARLSDDRPIRIFISQ
jgi:hypothetical protein